MGFWIVAQLSTDKQLSQGLDLLLLCFLALTVTLDLMVFNPTIKLACGITLVITAFAHPSGSCTKFLATHSVPLFADFWGLSAL